MTVFSLNYLQSLRSLHSLTELVFVSETLGIPVGPKDTSLKSGGLVHVKRDSYTVLLLLG